MNTLLRFTRLARFATPALLALATLTASARAAIDPKYDPKHVTLPTLHPIKTYTPQRFVMKNGMVVFLQEDHQLPVVSGSYYCRSSTGWDPADKVGLGSITGNVMRSGGTAKHSGDWLDDRLAAIGGSIDTGLDLDFATGSFHCLTENAAEVIGLFGEILREPAFPEDKIQLAMVGARRGIAQRNDDLTTILRRVARQAIYGKDHPAARVIEYATLDAIHRDDLVKFHPVAFAPERSYLVVYGDFKSADMKKLLTTRFGDWKKSGLTAPPMPGAPGPSKTRLLYAPKLDVTQSGVVLAHAGFRASDPDNAAMDVYENLLGGGFQSRLFNKIRTERGLAYSAGAVAGSGFARPGVFQAFSLTRSESTMVALDLLRSEVARSLDQPLGDDEVKLARETVLNGLVFANSSPSAVAFRTAYYEMLGYPKDFLVQYQKGIEATTPASVQEAARRKVHPDQFVAVIVGKEKDFDRPLESAGLAVERVDITIPPPAAQSKLPAATPASLEQGGKWLAKATELAGGHAAWAAVKTWQSEGSLKVSVQGQSLDVQQSLSWQLPDKRLAVQKLPFGEMSSGFDGKTGWRKAMGQIQDQPNAAKQAIEEYAQSLFHLFRDGATLQVQALAEPQVVDGVSCSVAAVKDETVREWTLYFAPDGKLARMSFASEGPKGPAQETQSFADWKPVGGIQYPHTLSVLLDGEKYVDGTITSAKVNVTLDPTIFAKPAN